jgi:hypothetical protein
LIRTIRQPGSSIVYSRYGQSAALEFNEAQNFAVLDENFDFLSQKNEICGTSYDLYKSAQQI